MSKYPEPLLVLKTEEPGIKQILAFYYNRIESVCYDMINHLINDCVVMGATPLAVQDLVVYGKLKKEVVSRISMSLYQLLASQDKKMALRVTILKLVRLLTGSKVYRPVEFFMTVMAMDMLAPEYGKHTLKEYFTILNNPNP